MDKYGDKQFDKKDKQQKIEIQFHAVAVRKFRNEWRTSMNCECVWIFWQKTNKQIVWIKTNLVTNMGTNSLIRKANSKRLRFSSMQWLFVSSEMNGEHP